jgi:hypothetical protein
MASTDTNGAATSRLFAAKNCLHITQSYTTAAGIQGAFVYNDKSCGGARCAHARPFAVFTTETEAHGSVNLAPHAGAPSGIWFSFYVLKQRACMRQ